MREEVGVEWGWVVATVDCQSRWVRDDHGDEGRLLDRRRGRVLLD